MNNPHEITKHFEAEICRYTGSKFCVAIDNESNALFLCLMWNRKCYIEKYNNDHAPWTAVIIPSHTYPSVPQEILHAGYRVAFEPSEKYLTGSYRLRPFNIYDSALHFTSNMYIPGSFMCLSFTGPHKQLKLGKGGAILTDNEDAYKWFKKARFSGRGECSYHDDNFDDNPVLGWNFYLPPETAARGLHMMPQFWNADGTPKHNEPLSLPYPDLSKFDLWK